MSRNHPATARRPAIIADGRRGGVRFLSSERAPRPRSTCAVCGGMAFSRCGPCRELGGTTVLLCDLECAFAHALSNHPRSRKAS